MKRKPALNSLLAIGLLGFYCSVSLCHAQGKSDYYAASSPSSRSKSLHRQWMSRLDQNLSLAAISIPGSHDTCALHGGPGGPAIAPLVVCQKWSIRDQLEAGIRFFDIRCRMINDTFAIHHGPVYQKIGFGEVQKQCIAFLKQNPSECILMNVQNEHTKKDCKLSFAQIFKNYTSSQSDYWYVKSSIPTVREARGKIVLMPHGNYGIGGIVWNSNSKIKLKNNWTVKDNDVKWKEVSGHISAVVKDPNKGTMYINFASGENVKALKSPGSIAKDINERLYEFVRSAGRMGVIIMDFPGEKLIEKIINTNFGLKTYRVKIKTVKKYGAGTDSNIYLSVFGPRGSTGKIHLNKLIKGNAFQSGDLHSLSFNRFDVGQIQMVTVESDNKHPGAAWMLGYVEVNGKRFNYNDWIKKGNLKTTLK